MYIKITFISWWSWLSYCSAAFCSGVWNDMESRDVGNQILQKTRPEVPSLLDAQRIKIMQQISKLLPRDFSHWQLLTSTSFSLSLKGWILFFFQTRGSSVWYPELRKYHLMKICLIRWNPELICKPKRLIKNSIILTALCKHFITDLFFFNANKFLFLTVDVGNSSVHVTPSKYFL